MYFNFSVLLDITVIGARFSRTCWLCICSPQVSLEWSSDRAQPGVQVSLTASALEAPFHAGVMVMGTHGDTPRADLDFKVMQVSQTLFHLPKPGGLKVYVFGQKVQYLISDT